MPKIKLLFLKKFYSWPLFLLIASAFFHFIFLEQPKQVVFDEVHFGKFASAYFTGEYFFDIHPPLGKLIIASGAYLGGYQNYLKNHNPFGFDDIGEKMENLPVFGFRFFPALAGTFFPLVIFIFLKSLGLKNRTAQLISFFCLIETSFLTQSRFILLDSFLILFGFLGLFFFFSSFQKKSPYFFQILAGIFLGASFSIKWTGLSFLGIALIFLTIEWLDNNEKWIFTFFSKIFSKKIFSPIKLFSNFNKKNFFQTFLSLFLILFSAITIYISSFALHFSLLSKEGPGDAFMEENFRQKELNFWGKFIQLNQKMNMYNSNLTATHPDDSFFWQWPIMKEPIHYWNSGKSRIIFFGNPILWTGGFLGIIFYIIFWKRIHLDKKIKFIFLVGFWSNFLPFFAVSRSLFLYHYLSALVFSLIFWGIFLTEILDWRKKWVKIFQFLFIFLSLVSFFLFSFLAYGIEPLNQWHKKIIDFFLYY